MSAKIEPIPSNFFTRKILNDDEYNFLIRFYTKTDTSTLQTDAAEAERLIRRFDLSKEQQQSAVSSIKEFHSVVTLTMSRPQKLQQLKQLTDGYQIVKKGTWMRSAFIKLIEDWVDRNSPTLDNAISEIYAQPEHSMAASAA